MFYLFFLERSKLCLRSDMLLGCCGLLTGLWYVVANRDAKKSLIAKVVNLISRCTVA